MGRDSKLDTDPDFIIAPKHGNSLKKLLEDYPGGVPNYIICRCLSISPEKLKETYKCAISKLRDTLGVELQEDDEPDDEL